MWPKSFAGAFGILCSTIAVPAVSQTVNQQAADILSTGLSSKSQKSASNDVRDLLTDVLQNPATINKVNQSITDKDSGLPFLRDIDFKLKAFDSKSENSDPSFGFSYEYKKVITDGQLGDDCGDSCTRGYNMNFTSNGNVAFVRKNNPDDFLDTKLSFSMFQSNGGAIALSPEGQKKYNELALKAASADQVTSNKAYGDILDLVKRNLTTQTYFDLAGEFSLESDQAFTEKQYVYGARLGIDFKAWGDLGATRWSETSLLGRLNVLDYPFAFIRQLTGFESCGAEDRNFASCFTPRGQSLPTASVSIARVSPQDNDPRSAAGDGSDFDRFNAEISFRTPFAKYDNEPIYFGANYRYYKELGAARTTINADVHEFDYFVATIGKADGLFFSYSTGKLPLDQKDDQVFAIGFKTHF